MKTALLILLGVLTGFLIGKIVYQYNMPQETFAQSIRQKDGSLVLERNPYEKPKTVQMPNGAQIFRQATFIVNPSSLDKINLTVSLVKMPDETLRTIVKTDNGEIVGGTDIPVDLLKRPIDYNYTAGVIYGNGLKGLFLQRDLGRFTFGLDLYEQLTNYDKSYGYNFRLGYKF
jgi:hypothetical protein